MKRIKLLLCAFALSTLAGQAQLSNLTPKNGAESADAGKETNPYVINNQTDLNAFRQAIKGDETSGICFELGASIDVSGSDWAPMGVFKGTLDGKGKAIQGLKVGSLESPASLEIRAFGFFSNMDGALVRNLQFTSTAIYIDMSSGSGHGYCGVLCAGSSQTNPNYVLNCSVSGTIKVKNETASGSSSLHVGGLIGQALKGTRMINCFGNVEVEISSAQIANAGGLIGTIEKTSASDVVNCYTQGSILSKGCQRTTENQRFFVGGVCGLLSETTGRLLNSYSSATVEATSANAAGSNLPFVGGVAGGCINATASSVKNCLALGTSLKASQAGKNPNIFRVVGYIGDVNISERLQISDCYANATMTLTRNDSPLEPSKKGADQIDGADITEAFSAVDELNNYVKANPNYEYAEGKSIKLLTWKSENGSIVFGETPTVLSNEMTNEEVKCFVTDGVVTFEGVESNATFQLSSLSGQLLTNGQLTDRLMALDSKGIYLVRIGGQTFKVAY